MNNLKNKANSIKTRLNVTIIAFAMIPVVLISILFISQVQKNLIKDQENSINKQLNLLNKNIGSFFDAMLDNVSYFAQSEVLKKSDDTIVSYAQTQEPTLMTPAQNKGVEGDV